MMRNDEKGAVAVLVSVMLVLLMVCVALVVDLGHIHNVKVQLQRAVDATALAGAQQLDGSTGAVQAAKDTAVAVAAANRVDQESVLIVADDLVPGDPDGWKFVQLGKWDDKALGDSARERFVATEVSPDAVKVTAIREVEHVFFFWVPGLSSTTVTADAIAVATPVVPVLPLALVSCIPTEDIEQNAGTLPGMTICDIASYNFKTDQDDTAAWTSLTFKPASSTNIKEFLEPGTGREKFNQVVFGKGTDPPNFGIENQSVDTARPALFDPAYKGCTNIDLDIKCGLGQINDKDIAPPSEFTPPSPLPGLVLDPVTSDFYTGTSSFDPLAAYDPLPRWYNLNTVNVAFDEEDHFTRIWSQDGILLKGPGEDDDAYRLRLEKMYDPDHPEHIKPYNDNRFVAENKGGGGLIEEKGNKIRPRFGKAAQYAGYPKVYVNNGVQPPDLKLFLSNILDESKTALDCEANDPLAPGQTVRVNTPVIFAGSCDEWKALGNSDEHVLSYIGIAKFLITRAWLTNTPYDCGEPPFVDSTGQGCGTFSPPVAPDGTFSAVNFNTPATLEGLNLVPVSEDEAEEASILKVYLVE